MSDSALGRLRILDLSRVLAGPLATMTLADLGAEVTKIERPGSGDDTRSWGPPHDSSGEATYFQAVNRNKTSVALDLGDPGDLAEAHRLALASDVVVENFRPGVMAKLGLDYESLAAENPGLVYCSVSGFGGSGPGAELPGYDLLVQALGGLMSVTGEPDGEPLKVGVALVDVITGLHAAVGILAAVRHREQTGEGQHVEVELMTSLLAALVNQSSAYVSAGVVPTPAGNRHPSIAPYETFPTADRQIALACGNDKQFRALCIALDLLSLPDEPRFSTNPSRVEHADDLRAILSTAFARAGADHWHEVLTKVGVPCGPINDIDAAFAFAESLGLAPVVEVPTADGGTLRQVSDPITLSATPPTYRSAPPRLGADTDAVVAWLRDPA